MPYEDKGVIVPNPGTQTPNELAREMDTVASVSRAEYIKNMLLGNTAMARSWRVFFVLAVLYGAAIRG